MNTKRMIKFPSIDQFPTVVTNINRHFNYVGLDENGDAIYDKTLPKPKLKFKGRVKLHGTNAAVCYNEPGGTWAQSRENIITASPQTFYEIEFEDGTKVTYNSSDLVNGKSIKDFSEGDSIIL